MIGRTNDDAEGCRDDGFEGEAVGGDDAVVEDVIDVGLSGEKAHGFCVGLAAILGANLGVELDGLDGGDAEALAALEEACSGDLDAGFGVSGDGGVVVDDDVAVGNDGGGFDLCVEVRGKR